ncbi:isomerase [Ignicoccus pacificus DSM 13166]|uniref:Isomerase n=1 Tax=Ignicoccus pacificus DSM 13166 TaxID=940294 RepID=A0A977PK26_9CREN|nr:isomerase [Ignicoccus pacificus DSM 13166]
MIVRYLGNDKFVISSKDLQIAVNHLDGEISIGLKDGEYTFCPKGLKCKNPVEGWVNWKHVSVLIAPKGLVFVDEKTSIGLWEFPPAIHVDFIISNVSKKEMMDKPYQDIRALQEGDIIDPFLAITYSKEQVHQMKLDDKWFELILKEEKVVEGRLYDEKRRRIRVGHIIEFKSVKNKRKIYCRVKRYVIYNNFKEMLENEGTERVLPGFSVEEAEKVYEGYYGLNAGPVVALSLELL